MPTQSTPLARRTVIRTAAAAGSVAGFGRLAAATSTATELLVGVAHDDPAGAVDPVLPAGAAVVRENRRLGYAAVRFPADADDAVAAFADAVTARPGVEYVEPNRRVVAERPAVVGAGGTQCVPDAVNADAAWDVTTGSDDVTVAVVDSGVQYDHPDLAPNVGADPGRDFVDGDDDPYPDDLATETGGTRTAGFVAAAVDDGSCIAGMGNSTLLAARVVDEDGATSLATLADGIQWAADRGAVAVPLAFAGTGDSPTLHDAVSYAADEGCLPVAAAGDHGGGVRYPAAYPECVAVSALTCDDSLGPFSSTGPEIEVAAPGVDVLGLTTSVDGYCGPRLSGTAAAAAVVAGVAGLAAARHDVAGEELRAHLADTAVDVGLPPDQQGSGRVDAANAVDTPP